MPSYDLRACRLADVRDLFLTYHGYGSVGSAATYVFAVYEDGKPVAAYAWQPPPAGAAKAVGGSAPFGVLALSRMVAVPKEERRLKHVSKPLRDQMHRLVDRGRWPTLLTYSDHGQGHTGYVYACSGWAKDGDFARAFFTDASGARKSSYRNGKHDTDGLSRGGTTTLTRWVHRACALGEEAAWMAAHGWRREAIPGKVWRSGSPAFTIVRR